VDECKLDMNAVLQRRKLILSTPAIGKAMVALDETDFGNFLTHPLLKRQVPEISIGKFEFDKTNIMVQHENGGQVIFHGHCGGERWKCILKLVASTSSSSNVKRAVIDVTHVSSMENSKGTLSKPTQLPNTAISSSITATTAPLSLASTAVGKIETSDTLGSDLEAVAMELTMVMTQFFNDLVFELDGTFLSFEDMKIHRPKGKNAQVLMALRITVKKFPSPGVAF
jgi:hypothetical protein